MIKLPDYKKATNAAYEILCDREPFSLSTDVFDIAGHLDGCRLLTYGQAMLFYGFTTDMLWGQSEFGFTFVQRSSGKRIILYNEWMPLSCIRFTLAHEIGHKVLQHQDEDSQWEEREANCFARNLLCPIPVIEEFSISSAGDYMSAFDVSEQMASVSMNWRGSDSYYIDDAYRSCLKDKAVAWLCGFENVQAMYRALYA